MVGCSTATCSVTFITFVVFITFKRGPQERQHHHHHPPENSFKGAKFIRCVRRHGVQQTPGTNFSTERSENKCVAMKTETL